MLDPGNADGPKIYHFIAQGLVCIVVIGRPFQVKLLANISTTRRDLERLASHFGLTPSARVSLAHSGGENDATADKYGL